MPCYPIPMVVYALIICWTLVYLVMERPLEGLMALVLIVSGGVVYWLTSRRETSGSQDLVA